MRKRPTRNRASIHHPALCPTLDPTIQTIPQVRPAIPITRQSRKAARAPLPPPAPGTSQRTFSTPPLAPPTRGGRRGGAWATRACPPRSRGRTRPTESGESGHPPEQSTRQSPFGRRIRGRALFFLGPVPPGRRRSAGRLGRLPHHEPDRGAHADSSAHDARAGDAGRSVRLLGVNPGREADQLPVGR